MPKNLQEAFLKWGWSLIAFLPVLEVLGRGVFNTLGAVYYLWVLVVVYYQQDLRLERRVTVLFAVLLGTYLLSGWHAQDVSRALKSWTDCLIFSSMFVFLNVLLERDVIRLDRLLLYFGRGALLALVFLAIRLIYAISQPDFTPTQHMREDNLPFLTPLLLYWLQHCSTHRGRHVAALLLIVFMGAYIVLSEGRHALLAYIVALFLYGLLVSGWRKRTLVIVITALLSVCIVFSGDRFFRHANDRHDVTTERRIDMLTSYRTEIWRNALNHPPGSLLTGVGMANAAFHPEVVTAHSVVSGKVLRFKHLHNFLLDTWYETGFLGLTALVTWLLFLFRRGIHVWRSTSGEVRRQAGTLLASTSAILTGALLSYSYTSRQFALYAFMFLAALNYLYSRLRVTALADGYGSAERETTDSRESAVPTNHPRECLRVKVGVDSPAARSATD